MSVHSAMEETQKDALAKKSYKVLFYAQGGEKDSYFCTVDAEELEYFQEENLVILKTDGVETGRLNGVRAWWEDSVVV